MFNHQRAFALVLLTALTTIVGGKVGGGRLHDAKGNPHPSGCNAKEVQECSGGTEVAGMAFSWLLVVWGETFTVCVYHYSPDK